MIIDCPRIPASGLESLPSDMACRLGSSCTDLDCCVNVAQLGFNIHAFVHIDPCTYDIHIGIDQMKYASNLLDYVWGATKKISLNGVVSVE